MKPPKLIERMVRWKKLNLSLRPYKPLLSKSCSLKMMPEVPINANISWFATKPKCIRDSSNVYWVWLDLAEVSALKKGPKNMFKRNHWGNIFWQRKLPKHWSLTIMYISRREIKWRNSDHNILLWIDLSVNCESPVRSMGGVLRILWRILWPMYILFLSSSCTN